MTFFRSPLIHIGGKYWLVKHLLPLLQQMPRQPLLSPFLGGGALELNIAFHLKFQILGFDQNEELTDFWNVFLSRPDELCETAKRLVMSISREKLNEAVARDDIPLFDKCALFLALNKLSYRGTGGSFVKYQVLNNEVHVNRGPVNFRYKHLEKLNECNIEVKPQDFKDTLAEHRDVLAYLDPPYTSFDGLLSSKLRPFDHHGLNKILKERDSWILSYSHIPEIPYIKMAYQDYFMIHFMKHNGLTSRAGEKRCELLIFSHDLVKTLRLKEA